MEMTILGSFIKPQVSRASQNIQTPQFGRLDGEGDVVFIVPTVNTEKSQVEETL